MKILTILGVFIASVLGISPPTTLGSQVNTEVVQNTTQPKKKQITSQADFYNSDETYLFVAKNYSISGQGVFYNTTLDAVTLQTSRVLGTDTDTLTTNQLYMDFTIINNTSIQASRLTITGEASAGIVYLSSVYLLYSSVVYNIYKVSTQTFNTDYCSFIGSNFSSVSGYELTLFNILTDLFYIYTFGDTSFTFNPTINYNAPFGYAIASSFVVGDAQTITYELPWFYSNGLAFNQIQLYYIDAYATRYINQDGDIVINSSSGFAYYSHMCYVNTATNLYITVNSRLWSTYTDSSDNVQYYLNNTSVWANSNYQELIFSDSLTPTQYDYLSLLNTNLGIGYIDYTGTDNIGLGSVFTLIGLAFSAVAGFLAIQIMPGLSLGVLLFAPLIVGIIIAVIWIVKR